MDTILELESLGIRVGVDNEGYLLDPTVWTADIAREFATIENIELDKRHWSVIYFVRDFYELNQIVPAARFVLKMFAEEYDLKQFTMKELMVLFPYGYGQQACKIAGMRKPLKLMLDV